MGTTLGDPEKFLVATQQLRQSIVDGRQLTHNISRTFAEALVVWKSSAAHQLAEASSQLTLGGLNCWQRLEQATNSIEKYGRHLLAANQELVVLHQQGGDVLSRSAQIIVDVTAVAHQSAVEINKARPNFAGLTFGIPASEISKWLKKIVEFGWFSKEVLFRPDFVALGRQAAYLIEIQLIFRKLHEDDLDELTDLFQQYGNQQEFLAGFVNVLGPRFIAFLTKIPNTPSGDRLKTAIANSIVHNEFHLPKAIQQILAGPKHVPKSLLKKLEKANEFSDFAEVMLRSTKPITGGLLSSLTKSSLVWHKEATWADSRLESMLEHFKNGTADGRLDLVPSTTEPTQELLALSAADPAAARELLLDDASRHSILFGKWSDGGEAAASVIDAATNRQGVDSSKNAPVVQAIFNSSAIPEDMNQPAQLVRRSLLGLTFRYLDAFAGIPAATTGHSGQTDVSVVSVDFDTRRDWLTFVQQNANDSMALHAYTNALADHLLESAAQNPFDLAGIAVDLGGLKAAVHQGRIDALEQSLAGDYKEAKAVAIAHNEELETKKRAAHVVSEILGFANNFTGPLKPIGRLGVSAVTTFSNDVLDRIIDYFDGKPVPIPEPDYLKVIDEEREGSQATFDHDFAVDLAQAIFQAHQVGKLPLSNDELSLIRPVLADLELGHFALPDWKLQHPQEVAQVITWIGRLSGQHGEILAALDGYHRAVSDALQVK